MSSANQRLIDAGQSSPILVLGSKGDESPPVRRVGVGNCGPSLACRLFGKCDEASGCRRRRIDSGFRHGNPLAIVLTK